jgi:hypothetical protein
MILEAPGYENNHIRTAARQQDARVIGDLLFD